VALRQEAVGPFIARAEAAERNGKLIAEKNVEHFNRATAEYERANAAEARAEKAERLLSKIVKAWEGSEHLTPGGGWSSLLVEARQQNPDSAQPQSVYDQLVGMFGKEKLDAAIADAKHGPVDGPENRTKDDR
jgi:hypothetical protein